MQSSYSFQGLVGLKIQYKCLTLRFFFLISHSCLLQCFLNEIWKNKRLQLSQHMSCKFETSAFVSWYVTKQLVVCDMFGWQGNICRGVMWLCVPIRTVISGPSIRSPTVWRSEMLPKWTLAANFANQGAECKEQSSARESVGERMVFLWLQVHNTWDQGRIRRALTRAGDNQTTIVIDIVMIM